MIAAEILIGAMDLAIQDSNFYQLVNAGIAGKFESHGDTFVQKPLLYKIGEKEEVKINDELPSYFWMIGSTSRVIDDKSGFGDYLIKSTLQLTQTLFCASSIATPQELAEYYANILLFNRNIKDKISQKFQYARITRCDSSNETSTTIARLYDIRSGHDNKNTTACQNQITIECAYQLSCVYKPCEKLAKC